MIYKQDYKVVVHWDINGNMYWKLFRKDKPVLVSEEERAMLKEELTKRLKKLK